MNAATYLRRALLAPIAVPLLAALPLLRSQFGWETAHSAGDTIAACLMYVFWISGVPFLWLLWAERKRVAAMTEREMLTFWHEIPLALLSHFVRFAGATAALLFLAACLCGREWISDIALLAGGSLIAGIFIVPFTYILYAAVTILFLRGLQRFDFVEAL